jgi:hypothetical protein
MLEAFNDGVGKLTQDTTRTELAAARDAGCYICYALLRWKKPAIPEAGEVRLGWRFIDMIPQFHVNHLRFDLHRQATGDDRSQSNEASLSAYEAPAMSSDPEAQRLVGTWLQRCTSTHEQCERSRESGYMPPRLLDLRDGQIRLISTSNSETTGGYATLSHCWGRDPTFLTLNTGNYDRFFKSISLDELPKTFRDSVMLCRTLDITYLWIDSLCIPQGPGVEEDWLRHVAAMPYIYRHALLNVSADWASSSKDGLFHERSAALRPSRVAFKEGVLSGPFYITTDEDEGLESKLETAPLQGRGWVMQERILSPRIVHYTQGQMCWECSESVDVCERWPNGQPGFLNVKGREHLGMRTLNEPGNVIEEREHIADLMKRLKSPNFMDECITSALDFGTRYVEMMAEYNNLVSAYNQRDFTYPNLDKLPAFGSIAEQFSRSFNAKYIAGLFEFHLPSALTWHVTSSQKARSVTATYRCPSWSWASVNSPVSFYCGLRTQHDSRGSKTPNLYLPLAQMKSHSVELKDQSNPFGQITGASMVLQAPMVQCRWEVDVDQKRRGA